MKTGLKRIAFALMLVLVLAMAGTAFAEAGSGYDALMSMDRVSLDDAIAQMEESDSADEQAQELLSMLQTMKKCSGVFVQERSGSTGKAYSATVEFWLERGVPYCQVNYSNYMGVIGEAPVERAENGPYLLHTEPVGTLYSREQPFRIDIGEENLRIAWGESNEYTLDRGSGAASDYENSVTPFTETEEYAEIVEVVDGFFKTTPHHCLYNEADRTLYAYFQAKEGLFQTLVLQSDRMRDSVSQLVESLTPMSTKLGAYMSLAVRDGGFGSPKGHFSVVLVDTLNEEDVYEKGEDIIFEVKDGRVAYNLLDELAGMGDVSKLPSDTGRGTQSQPAPKPSVRPAAPAATPRPDSSFASMGQRNALQRAQEYLDYMAFSYTGLIEQLEYEGFTRSEAEYAADHCGADWNRQAARKAKDYLDFMAFSREGLIEQLEYEGFTHSQAVYGAGQNGY